MLGLQTPSHGHALIRGIPASDDEAKQRIAYLPERPLLYDYLTPAELVEMSLTLHRWRGDMQRQRDTWLARLGLGKEAKRRVAGFSKGMAQRVALAMVLSPEPEAIVLDEPLSGLDPNGRKEIVEILDEYHVNGGTLFFSSHVLSDVERLADRFLFIQKGEIRATHNMATVLKAGAEVYEIFCFSQAPVLNYHSVGRNLWSHQVPVSELPRELARLGTTNAALHSVRSSTSVEQLYFRLVNDKPTDDV
jgi:ABC-2 type transport system ATP-binding protein